MFPSQASEPPSRMLIGEEFLETHYSLARALYAAAPQHLAVLKGQKPKCVVAFTAADQLEPFLCAGSETGNRERFVGSRQQEP